MFLIRQSKPDDVQTLAKLARMVYFINLPPSEQIIQDKIVASASSFVKAGGGHVSASAPKRGKKGVTGLAEQSGDIFMFTIEDLEAGGVVGTSQIRPHMGGPGNPNWRMKLTERKFFAPELGQGTTHTVAQLDGDESGPTEIGGLIIQPSHRGHRLRPGRFLSFVRFHFIALHRAVFADTILAEMMGPVTSEGDNVFWDAFGRKFIPVKYAEADRFCQHNRKFISELLPKEEIYITLFPLEIQNVVGTVSKETVPARRLLESLGFKYRGYIDPFDAGPHLDAPTESIELVRSTRRLELGKPVSEDRCDAHGIVSVLTSEGEFRAIESACSVSGNSLRLPEAAMAVLEANPGAKVGFTPLPPPEAPVIENTKRSKTNTSSKGSGRRKVRA
jgi:arginine N-succinyltransferase